MESLPSLLRPALFLDRDGVINVEKNYVHCIEDFEFLDGVFDLCRAATERNMPIVVVTKPGGHWARLLFRSAISDTDRLDAGSI